MNPRTRALREFVWAANLELADSGLVTGTFGNVSGADRDAGLFAIKPSGVPYAELTPDHMVLVSLETGEVARGDLRPSSDTPTHHELYRAFPCGGIAHTHSEFATTLAQARLPVRCMGTTHADHFRGDVPVTRGMTEAEVAGEYERNTGLVIVEAFAEAGVSPDEVAAVLVANHGPFTWGADAHEAVARSEMLELLARMECTIRAIAPDALRPAPHLIDRHFLRKHGKDAYYGQE
ncbi:MAG: L-ribulose-5-phosphate 4-epimerase AraD [Gemmatimonadetes bacterium]|nr:L-ribulose-5-phosphate 4-epimerase AraD [Gemmatimonadota bacterium]MYJ69523.1 L-ribulose-5-phosphate 4-epimerase AraD [Gemmatimonadota bacterium]